MYRVMEMRRNGRRLRERELLDDLWKCGDLASHNILHGDQYYRVLALIGNRAISENVLPPLYEWSVSVIRGEALLVMGYQRIEEGNSHRAIVQEWRCEIAR